MGTDKSEGLAGLIDDTFDTDIGDGVAQGLMSGLESISGGASAGRGIMAGIGGMLGGQLGAAIGDTLGSVLEATIGGEVGSHTEEELNALKDDINEFEEEYEGLSHLIDDLDYSDDTNPIRSLFGGSDINVFNEEEIQEQMERIGAIADTTFSTLESGLREAFTEAVDYNEMKKMMDNTIGQAIIDSMTEAFMQSQMIEEQLEGIRNIMTEAAVERRELTEEELIRIELHRDEMLDFAEEYRNTLDQVDIGDIGDVDSTTSQSFTAGTTTSVTYQNHYTVRSQAFNGTREEAKEFVRLIGSEMANYLQDKHDFQTG